MDSRTTDGKTRVKQYLLNVILDLLLNRSPWAGDAAFLWDAHRQGQIRAFLAAFTLPTIFYIVNRQAGLPAETAVASCLSTLDIAPVAPNDSALSTSAFGPGFRGRFADCLCDPGWIGRDCYT